MGTFSIALGLGTMPASLLSAEPAPFSVSLTGLTSGEARHGSIIGLDITPAITTETVTYQWQEDAGNIPGATSATERIEIGTIHGDAASLRCVVTIDGVPFTSASVFMRYAPGSAPAVANGQSWTRHDTNVSLDGSATGTGLTFSYMLTDAIAGVSINPTTGAVTGTPTATGSGTATIRATDQYGRELAGTFTWTSSLRTQAMAGVSSDLSYPEGIAIAPYSFNANFNANGNTLTYTAVDTLPAGLLLSTGGTLSGTPGTVMADAIYTIRATDEYGRITDLEVAIEITKSFSFNLSETLDGEIEIIGSQPTSITITSPAHYAGTYMTEVGGTALSAIDFTAGPACIIAPLIKQTVDADASGTINAGDTVGIGTPDAKSYPGVWLYDTDNGAPKVTYQWQTDEDGNGTFASLTGASATVVLTSNEAGDDVRIQETATDTGGARSVNSNAISVSGATAYTFTDNFRTGYSANDDVPTVSSNWSYVQGSAGSAQTATISNPAGELILSSSGSNGSTGILHEDGGAIANDQVAQITLAANLASGGVSIFTICRGTDADNYVQFGYAVNSNTWLLHERVGGTTDLLTSDGGTAGPVAGDTISIEVFGMIVTGKLNGTPICTGTLASLSTGKIGTRVYAQNGKNVRLTEFTGGDL